MTKGVAKKSVDGSVRKSGKWAAHVKQYRDLHKVSFKDALKAAGATYVKITKERKPKGEYKKNPWMVHISDWKAANPDWKQTLTYKQVLQTCKSTYTRPEEPVKEEEELPSEFIKLERAESVRPPSTP
jgi:hypothetical protein